MANKPGLSKVNLAFCRIAKSELFDAELTESESLSELKENSGGYVEYVDVVQFPADDDDQQSKEYGIFLYTAKWLARVNPMFERNMHNFLKRIYLLGYLIGKYPDRDPRTFQKELPGVTTDSEDETAALVRYKSDELEINIACNQSDEFREKLLYLQPITEPMEDTDDYQNLWNAFWVLDSEFMTASCRHYTALFQAGRSFGEKQRT